MVNVLTSYNNFARGKVDHDMMGRFDLPIYTSSADVMENFETNFKGNAMYRAGLEDMVGEFEDCVLHEFLFRNDQNYILVFYENTIRFLTYASDGTFGWVLSGGTPLEVTTTYTLEDCRTLQFAQNGDVVVITHNDYPPKDLTRVAADNFTFEDRAFNGENGSPFTGISSSITSISTGSPTTVSVNPEDHNLSTGDVVTLDGIGGMTELNGNSYIVTVVNTGTVTLNGTDTTDSPEYTGGGTITREEAFPKCCAFYKARLYFSNTPTRPTTVWASEAGNFEEFDITGTVTDITPLQFTIAEISQPIAWLFGGENSLILGCAQGIVAVNGGGVGQGITADNIEADLTPTDGSNDEIPLAKDGLIFYQGKNSRNVYYFSYDLLTESFKSNDANFLSYDITKSDLRKIRYKKDRNDLLYMIRNDGKWLSLNFKEEENIVGWHAHSTYGLIKDIVVISDNDGNPQIFFLVDRQGAFYIEKQSERVEFSERSSFFTNDEMADDEAYNRKVSEELNQCVYLDNSLKINNLQENNTITYQENTGSPWSSGFSSGFGFGTDSGTITAASPVFSSGDVGKHISYKTETGYESGRFEITGYTSTTVVEVVILQEPTSNTYDNWYLSFSSLSGLDQYNGETIGVVTDGGFLDEFLISGGVLNFDSEVLNAVVGYTYRGVIKSFSLGFQIKAENTQVTMKAITQTGMRCVASAGGKFGSSPYRLEPMQKLSQNDLNYLPPLPVDGTEYISYTDENERDKYFYVVQDEPLPLTVASVFVNANYSVTQ